MHTESPDRDALKKTNKNKKDSYLIFCNLAIISFMLQEKLNNTTMINKLRNLFNVLLF